MRDTMRFLHYSPKQAKKQWANVRHVALESESDMSTAMGVGEVRSKVWYDNLGQHFIFRSATQRPESTLR